MQKLECCYCHRDFTYEVLDDRYPGCKNKEEIKCPYCHQIVDYEMTSGVVRTYTIELAENEDEI